MKLIPISVSRSIGSSELFLRRNAPTIMFAGGVMGVVASTVMACRATLKLSDELPKMKHNLEQAREDLEDGEENTARSLTLVYVDNAVKVAKLYAPTVAVGSLAIGALTGSHVTLNRRNAGLTAAYAAVSKAYDEYRARVRDELGDEKERDIYQGAVVEKVVGEDGKKTKVTTIDPSGTSPYSRLYDESSYNFQKDAQYNLCFIKAQQDYANDLLHRRGFVFLNEVLKELGLDMGNVGAQVGWVVDGDGDGYIDYGLDRYLTDPTIDPKEPRIWLDFNVDGTIIGKIKE